LSDAIEEKSPMVREGKWVVRENRSREEMAGRSEIGR